MNELHVRSFALVRNAATSEDGRTLSIRAVPWDTEIPLGADQWESFDPHAFDAQLRAANRVKLTLGHPRPGDRLTDSLIGSLQAMSAGPDGLDVEARVASSSAANEALALVNDGVLDQVSIGFFDLRTDRQKRAAGGTLHRRVAARLDHLALVGEGAYGEAAKVLAVRAAEDANVLRLADLRQLVDRLIV
jgi:HK97 family phage prohead protease